MNTHSSSLIPRLYSYLPGHGPGSLHPAEQKKGEYPVKSVLHRPQPEKSGAIRAGVGVITKKKVKLLIINRFMQYIDAVVRTRHKGS
jgi:hypothetical protein